MLLISIALASIVLSLLMLLLLSKFTVSRTAPANSDGASATSRWLLPLLGAGLIVLAFLVYQGFGGKQSPTDTPTSSETSVTAHTSDNGAATAGTSTASSAAAVGGVVTLSAKFKGKVSPEDTLFIVAKSPDGSGPPLAALRLKSDGFPVKFQLDDSAALMPGRSISQFTEVMVSAKISKGGSANASQGDILAAPVKAHIGDMGLVIELNSER